MYPLSTSCCMSECSTHIILCYFPICPLPQYFCWTFHYLFFMWLLLFISSSSYNKHNLIKHSFSNEVKQFILNDFYVYFSSIVSKKKVLTSNTAYWMSNSIKKIVQMFFLHWKCKKEIIQMILEEHLRVASIFCRLNFPFSPKWEAS